MLVEGAARTSGAAETVADIVAEAEARAALLPAAPVAADIPVALVAGIVETARRLEAGAKAALLPAAPVEAAEDLDIALPYHRCCIDHS